MICTLVLTDDHGRKLKYDSICTYRALEERRAVKTTFSVELRCVVVEIQLLTTTMMWFGVAGQHLMKNAVLSAIVPVPLMSVSTRCV